MVCEGDGAAEGGDGAGVLTLVPPLQVLHPQVVAAAQAATGDMSDHRNVSYVLHSIGTT